MTGVYKVTSVNPWGDSSDKSITNIRQIMQLTQCLQTYSSDEFGIPVY